MSHPARAARMVVAVMATTMLAVAAAGASSADAAPGDIGFEGQSYAPLGGSPTGSKPESKLWFADGVWWSVQFNGAAGEWRIHRLDTAAGLWRDTGVVTDRRDSTRADTIWDGAANKLYVASHIFDTTPQTASAGSSGRLYRFSYDRGTETYSLDAGFPVLINAARTETLVVDQDSTGTLWATWVLGNQVWVNHSTSPGGASWGTPYVLPGTGAVDDDDLSSLVHFGGDRIGVMWSDQATRLFHFAVHADGAGDDAADWPRSSISPGPAGSDDHVNLKAGRDGRVYAAVKTSGSGSQPLILLLVRATDGTWSSHTYGRKSDRLTRPIVVLDEQNHEVHVLVTCPGSANDDGNGENGGDICQKVAPMSDISFAPGPGATVIRDFDAPKMNDATSTKQGLSAASGLVVMANDSHDASRRFWHMHQSLATGEPQPTRVNAGFTASPTPAPGGPPPPPIGQAPINASAPGTPAPATGAGLGVVPSAACGVPFIGTPGPDRIDGSSAGDRAFGLAGNDYLRGQLGRDCLYGAAGDDTLIGDEGDDLLVGWSGDDRLYGGAGRDRLYGNSGRDRLYGNAGDDRLSGGLANDRLSGSIGADRLFGGYGRDHLYGGSGNDVLSGGHGNDTLFAGTGNDRIIGGRGRDIIIAGSGNDYVNARDGRRDIVRCGPGRDRVIADRSDALRDCERITRRR